MQKTGCLLCHTFNEVLFKTLKICPECNCDLLGRIARRKSMKFSRPEGFIAHSVENEYSGSRIEHTRTPLNHNAHHVLEYAAGLCKAANHALAIFSEKPESTYFLGFLTGSSPLEFLLRRHGGNRLENRIRHVRGLAHKVRFQDPDKELFDCLDAFHDQGMLQLVITDEFVSGTQFHTAYLRIRSWYEDKLRTGHQSWPLTIVMIGIQGEEPPKGRTKVASFNLDVFGGKNQTTLGELTFTSFMVPVPKLLAKDSEGRDLQTTALQASDGEYITARRSPLYYSIECPKGGASMPFMKTSGSLEQNFGTIIYSILGLGYAVADRWPATIYNSNCDECRSLLADARVLGKKIFHSFPPIEQVVGCIHVQEAKQ